MTSITGRLMIVASVVLALFFGLTGLILDRAFTHSAEAALQERLRGHVIALIAASEQDDDGVTRITGALPEARFFNPGSDLFAAFTSNDGRRGWRSPSMFDLEIPFPTGLARGTSVFRKVTASNGQVVQTYSLGVTWDGAPGPDGGYTFSVAEDTRNLNAQIAGFRRMLWGWLGLAAVILLVVQGTVLRWGLKPLRTVANDLAAIERGGRTRLQGRYPAELRPLTDNINALIHSNRERLERYRHSLGDLAHSLKTPLALLRGAVEGRKTPDELLEIVPEQVDRMSRTVDYQLQRAAASGGSALAAPVDVARVIRKVAAALDKVYAEKNVACHVQVDDSCDFHGDEGDLFEITGNLLDNAFKWCRRRIDVSAGMQEGTILVLTVSDDGPGIPAAVARDVRRRGVRAADGEDGHGIGLAVVDDIVRIYGGTLQIGIGSLGGARMEVRLPSR